MWLLMFKEMLLDWEQPSKFIMNITFFFGGGGCRIDQSGTKGRGRGSGWQTFMPYIRLVFSRCTKGDKILNSSILGSHVIHLNNFIQNEVYDF